MLKTEVCGYRATHCVNINDLPIPKPIAGFQCHAIQNRSK